MSELPNGWTRATLDECCEVVSGQSPPGETYNEVGDGLPFYQGKAEFGDLYPTPRKWCTQPTKTALGGDVLISVRAPVGPTNLASEVCCIGRGLAALRPRQGMRTRFVLYQMRASEGELAGIATGSTFSAVSSQQLKSHSLVVAPTDEQDRIVAEIEKQFTRLDAATKALMRVQSNLKRYRASVLKAACEGRLVPTEAELARKEGRDYEPADKLLQRILCERRSRWEADTLAKMITSGKPPKDDRWKEKYKEPEIPDTKDLPQLPEGWILVRLDTVADVIDPNPSHRTPAFVQRGFAFVSAENFVGDSSLDFKIGRQVGQNVLTDQIARFTILPGAFAMSRYGTIGKTCKLPPERDYCLSYSLVVIQSKSESVDSDFLRIVCSSGMIMALAKSRIQGATIPDLGVAHIRSLPITLPVMNEQGRIKEEVGRKLSFIDQLMKDVDHKLRHADRLRQSILKCAFAGNLVPQDPTDEPASTLLDRIRAERASAAPRKSRTRRQEEPTYA